MGYGWWCPEQLQSIFGIQKCNWNGKWQRKKGLLIKISDGMIMSFQGDILHHGTTIHRDSITGKLCPPGDLYGIHFGLSMPTLTSIQCIRIDQYIWEMCQVPKMIIHEKNDGMESDDNVFNGGKTLKKSNQIYSTKKKSQWQHCQKHVKYYYCWRWVQNNNGYGTAILFYHIFQVV